MMFLSHPAAKGCHIMKLEVVEMFRREGIYPFRNVGEHPKFDQWYSVPTTERQAPYGVDGPFLIQRTAVIIGGIGTDKSVPYAHVETFSILQTQQTPISQQAGSSG